jgi:thiol-disulfide isomerase/thioredoxin
MFMIIFSAHQNPCTPAGSGTFAVGMRLALIVCLLSLGIDGRSQGSDLVKVDKLQQLMAGKDQVMVINFWATWCGPCIKELPLFDKLAAERKDIHVMLVSLDLELDPDVEKVRKFVARKKIKADVLILNERKSTDYIDKLEKNWSGALPATLVVNNRNGKRKFVEKELHEGDLEKLITEVQ